MRGNRPFRAIALIAAYNEGDVISAVIGHLVENGVDVYLVDNRSTDDTATEASRWLGNGLISIEEFPAELSPGEPPPFDWTALLRRKEELASELDADWFLHQDADEFRESPFPGMRLVDAIAWVDRLDYNCIRFRVFNFPPTDDGFEKGMDPRTHFTYWEEPAEFDTGQLKAWKNTGAPPSLMPSGGHEVGLPERRVFPIPFLLRHYPIRGQAHGRRKVFSDRKGRLLEREREKRWHIQYDAIEREEHDFLADPARLRPFDDARVRLELMLANEITRWAEYQARGLRATLESRERELEILKQEKSELELRLNREEAHRVELERELAFLRESHREIASAVRNLERAVSNAK